MATQVEKNEGSDTREVAPGFQINSVMTRSDTFLRHAYTMPTAQKFLPRGDIFQAATQEPPDQRNQNPNKADTDTTNISPKGDRPAQNGSIKDTVDKDGNTVTTIDQPVWHEQRKVDPQGREISFKYSDAGHSTDSTTSYDQNGHKHTVTHTTVIIDGREQHHDSKKDETDNGWTTTRTIDGGPTTTTVHENKPGGYTETTISSNGERTITEHHDTATGWSEQSTTTSPDGTAHTIDQTYDRRSGVVIAHTSDSSHPNQDRTNSETRQPGQ